MNEFEQKCIEIYEHFGKTNQIEKLREEVEELIEALVNGTHEEQTEEYADVALVLQQLRLAHSIATVEIMTVQDKKVLRTLDRIESGYYEEQAEPYDISASEEIEGIANRLMDEYRDMSPFQRTCAGVGLSMQALVAATSNSITLLAEAEMRSTMLRSVRKELGENNG